MVLFPDDIEAVDYSYVQNKSVITPVAGVPYIIQADIQPATSEDEGISVAASPQGKKEIGLVKVFSNQKLVVPKEGTNQKGTVLTWEGEKWRIVQELPYQKSSFFTLVDHYKYFAELVMDEEL